MNTDTQNTPSRFWKRLGLVAVILAVSLLSLSLVVHIPGVQQWGIRKISRYLSRETGSAVSVRSFDFNIFSHVSLNDIYISQENTPSDTLLYAGELGIRFSRFWKLLSGNPEIKQVRLSGAKLYVDDRPLTFMSLVGKSRGGSGGVRIVEPKVLVENVVVRIAKSYQKMTQEFLLARGELDIDEINTKDRTVSISAIRMSEPIVHLLVKADSLIIGRDTMLVSSLEDTTTQIAPKPWTYDVGTIKIDGGQMTFLDPFTKEAKPLSGLNYYDLFIQDLDLEVKDLLVDSSGIIGEIADVSFREHSGFRLEKVSAKRFELSDYGIALGRLEVRTPNSVIADSIAIDFGEGRPEETMGERMNLYARFKDSELSVSELLHAIPELQESQFFAMNYEEVLHIDGVLHGRLNRLRGDDLSLRLGNMLFEGQFRSRDLTQKGKQVLNLEVSNAQFATSDLEKHLPGVVLPQQFRQLGKMRFRGKFDGYFEDFVAYGKLNTELGSAEVDMNLKTKNPVATYGGSISLQNFNLKRWTNIEDFGIVSADLKVTNGSGLTPETASANISGVIREMNYKGYTYRNALVDGHLNKNKFEGKLEIRDPNIDLAFRGTILFSKEMPVYDFVADINRLDLQKLNLSEEPFVVEGVIDAKGQGKDLHALVGSLRGSDIRVIRGTETYVLDTVFLDITYADDGRRLIRTSSDYVQGWVSGTFELNSLWPSLARYLEETYPEYFSGIKYRKDLSIAEPEVAFEVVLNKPEEWGGIINIRDIRFKDLHAKGVMDFARDSVIIDINAPEIHYKKVNTYLSQAHFESIGGRAKAETFVTVIDIDEKYFFDEITASVQTSDNGFTWSLAADDLLEELNTLGMSGTFEIDSANTYTVHIDPQIIEILDQQWGLREGNLIRFGKDFIELQDVVFQHEEEVIAVSDINRRGVKIETQNFDLMFIEDLWDYEKLNFSGPYSMQAGIQDIFTRENFYLLMEAPQVYINNTPYGSLDVDCRMEKMGKPVSLYVALVGPGVHVHAEGGFFPPVKEMEESLRNIIDVNIEVDTFPLAFLQYILKDGIHATEGYATGDLQLGGTLQSTKMDGRAVVRNGATTVTYLGTRYTFDNQSVRVSESFIDATGAVLTDELGNTAVVEGGLTHRVLSRIGLNATIRSPRILALNTTEEDNSIYYGRGIGSINAVFRGQVETPTISINAVTAEGTYIAINLADQTEEQRESFLRFRTDLENGDAVIDNETTITGMNFDMNLTATPDAVVEIILEDTPPESIVGSGSGDIQLSITRTGDFTMYGQYEIESGDYIFRSFVVINKPFQLASGGIIQWTGEPYNAYINLDAEYVGLRASLYPLIAEYLTPGTQAADEARRKTDVNLTLHLTGTLLEPEISFDFSFPNLTGELAGYADTKMRVLKANQNAMNEQVFGLLWAGSFLPSNVLQSDASIQLAEQGITNTMSEFVSSQASSVISSLLSRWVGADIDLDVGYSTGSPFDLPDAQASDYREWEVRLKNRLFDDRVILDAGANYGTVDNPVGTGTYFVGDYALEYLLTKDGRLKIRSYFRNERTIEGPKNKLGIGLAWRREFDSFSEWLGGLEGEARKMRKAATEPEPEAQVD